MLLQAGLLAATLLTAHNTFPHTVQVDIELLNWSPYTLYVPVHFNRPANFKARLSMWSPEQQRFLYGNETVGSIKRKGSITVEVDIPPRWVCLPCRLDVLEATSEEWKGVTYYVYVPKKTEEKTSWESTSLLKRCDGLEPRHGSSNLPSSSNVLTRRSHW